MTWMFRGLVVGTVAVALAAAAARAADEPKSVDPPKDYRWADAAQAQGLGEKEIELLRQNKFVLTGRPVRQVFSPYLGGKVPVFITTDSLLNAYHVLFEESVYRLEQANAKRLPGVLERLSKDLDGAGKSFKGDDALLAAARERAAVFLGTARNLLDDKALPDDPAVRALVREEVERVVAARETCKPGWLGKPDPGFQALDYSRFRPRGFYTRTPALERYFRAVSWLQAVPFRLHHDEEAVAFFVLSRAFRDPAKKEAPADEDFWGTFSVFLGAGDDWDLPGAYLLPKEISKESLDEVRTKYPGGGAQINDQLRFIASDGRLEVGFRFLAARRLADAVLFQRTTGPGKRDYPSGLDVCAILGSPFVRDKLKKDAPELLKQIDASQPLFPKVNGPEGASLYANYLQCLRVLLERTEPDAPEFLRGEAWKIKTCQTALAGWAQMRHTWTLQAKQGAEYMCASSLPTGFVEPVPEFYGRMAELMEATGDALKQAGALAPIDMKDILKEGGYDWQAARKIVEKARKEKKPLASFSAEERSLLSTFDPQLNDLWDQPEKGHDSDKVLSDLAGLLEMYDVPEGRLTPELFRLLGMEPTLDLASKWKQLTIVCRRLEIIAHVQLRQVPLSDEQNKFLETYGEKLAGIMLYSGNSYYEPRDDAMRIVDVFANPAAGKVLLVGTGRPREIWVLYPVKGVDVLCRGAAASYYEFTHSERLTDAAWKAMLDSPARPDAPDWVRPVTAPAGPAGKAKEE